MTVTPGVVAGGGGSQGDLTEERTRSCVLDWLEGASLMVI